MIVRTKRLPSIRPWYARASSGVETSAALGREAMSFKDSWYVALAERLDCPWTTSDRKAARTAEWLGVAVRIV